MISDDLGRRLHDRATHGGELTVEEQAQLDEWYASQDRAEAGELEPVSTQALSADLQAQVDAALAQLTAVTRRLQELAAENEALRRENASLRQRVPQLV